MQGGFFSYAMLAVLAIGLLFAAYTDLQRRQIDNWLTGAIALCAPLFWFAIGLSVTEIGYQIALALTVFIATAVLFALRQMGGGDVKLLAALALWIAPFAFMKLLIMMGLVGGAASIAGAAFNIQRRDGERLRDAIGAFGAFVWVGLCAGVIFSFLSGQPMISPHTLASVAPFLPDTWIVVGACLVLAALVIFGIFHIVQRQKDRLQIPYGVAISIAGIWIIANLYLPALQQSNSIG